MKNIVDYILEATENEYVFSVYQDDILVEYFNEEEDANKRKEELLKDFPNGNIKVKKEKKSDFEK